MAARLNPRQPVAMLQELAAHLPARQAQPPRFALTATAAACALGLLADLSFDGAGLGLNLPLWSIAALATVVAVAALTGVRTDPRRLLLACLAVAFTATVGVRASAWLHSLNLGAAATMLGLAVALPPGVGLKRVGFAAFVFALGSGWLALLLAPVRLLPQDPSKLRITAPLAREAAWIGRALLDPGAAPAALRRPLHRRRRRFRAPRLRPPPPQSRPLPHPLQLVLLRRLGLARPDLGPARLRTAGRARPRHP